MLFFFIYLFCLDSNTLFCIPSNIKDKSCISQRWHESAFCIMHFFLTWTDSLSLFTMCSTCFSWKGLPLNLPLIVYSFCLMLADVFRCRYKDNANCDIATLLFAKYHPKWTSNNIPVKKALFILQAVKCVIIHFVSLLKELKILSLSKVKRQKCNKLKFQSRIPIRFMKAVVIWGFLWVLISSLKCPFSRIDYWA